MEGFILAIESSTRSCSVAVSSPERLLSEVTFNLRADGGRRLAPVIRDMMDGLSLQFKDLSAVAVSCGPGSFTGLRIGMATGKALAQANRIPLYTANSLILLAYNASLSQIDICPLLDAGKGEVYSAVFRFEGDSFEEKMPPTVIAPRELLQVLPDPVVLIGEGWNPYREIFLEESGRRRIVAPPSLSIPRASYLAGLIHTGMVGESVEDIMGLEPLYIRRPEAEVRWKGKAETT